MAVDLEGKCDAFGIRTRVSWWNIRPWIYILFNIVMISCSCTCKLEVHAFR